MARFKDMSRNWKIATVVLGAIVGIIAVIAIVAGIKSGVEDISFIDALGNMFGKAIEVTKDVLPEAGEGLEEGAETVARMI